MPQSLSSVYLHIIFSTKDRFPFLSNRAEREETHAFLGGIAKNRECPPRIIGGTSDHVHLLLQLGRTISPADLVKELKRGSTIWIHEHFPKLGKFSWQIGYGVFSVSASNVDSVSAYIANQEDHHKRVSFQDEYRAFLSKHEIASDERYLWD